jgi:hypothetical protein
LTGAKPPIKLNGLGVSGDGIVFGGVTTCMQGVRLTDVTYTYTKQRCEAPNIAGSTMGPDKATFKAWKDEMPGSAHKLIVTGEVVFPTTGWKARLSEAVPQGINPSILVLELDTTKPIGNAGQMVTRSPVRFEKTPAGAYDQVMIRGAGANFTLDVGVVH